jgi:hypothetical protein
MTETEGAPTPQSARWGHQNTIIYLSGTTDGTADGSLTLMAQHTADGNAEGLPDLDGNPEGCLSDSDGSVAEGSPD